jgi:hypothetical protein
VPDREVVGGLSPAIGFAAAAAHCIKRQMPKAAG